MGICISEVGIKNYRSIKEQMIYLDNYNVLVGKNNSGKSNILQAIVLGLSYNSIGKDDIFVAEDFPFSDEKSIEIHIKIEPCEKNEIIKEFNDVWTLEFGDSIQTDAITDKEYFAFKTIVEFDPNREVYSNRKFEIIQWDGVDSITGKAISRNTISAIDAVYINAQRDISIDIKDKNSLWSKMTNNVNIPSAEREKIEKQLCRLNSQIVKSSDVLKLAKKTLKASTADSKSVIDISPITKDIDSLYKGMNIYCQGTKCIPTPMENLGLGVRSWAVFSTAEAAVLAKSQKRIESGTAFFPFVMIEEPEAHVHPQAQRQLYESLKRIKGQRIITTHSPYILSQVELEKIKYIKQEAAETIILPLLVNGLGKEDIRKIHRMVMNTKGEVLYANAVILAEGETEELALAIFAREYFGKEPFQIGLTIIGVGGKSYKPFVQLLNRLSIPWFIFSDGEDAAITEIKGQLDDIFDCNKELSDYDNVFVLDNKNCIETFYLQEGYQKEICKALDEVEEKVKYLDIFIGLMHGQNAKKNKIRDYKSEGGRERALKDCLLNGKTKYASCIAKKICEIKTPKNRRMPRIIKELFDKVSLSTKAGDQ